MSNKITYWSIKKELAHIEETALLLDLNVEALTKQVGDTSIDKDERDRLDELAGKVRQLKRLYGSRNEYLRCYLSGFKRRVISFNGKGEISDKDKVKVISFVEDLRDKEQNG